MAFTSDLVELGMEGKLIPRKHISVGDPQGEGHFGCVFEATYENCATGSSIKVAVKTLHEQLAVSTQNTIMFIRNCTKRNIQILMEHRGNPPKLDGWIRR